AHGTTGFRTRARRAGTWRIFINCVPTRRPDGSRKARVSTLSALVLLRTMGGTIMEPTHALHCRRRGFPRRGPKLHPREAARGRAPQGAGRHGDRQGRLYALAPHPRRKGLGGAELAEAVGRPRLGRGRALHLRRRSGPRR